MTETKMDACRKNIQQFLDRDLGQWLGLVTGCEEATLDWLAFNPGEGRTYLGTDYVTYKFRSLSSPGFVEGIFFYFARAQLSLIATDYWSFDRAECVELVKKLGEPAQRLDFCWRNQKLEGAELVYHDRGISLGIIPDTQVIASVMVYPACALDTYKAKYYRSTPSNEFRSDE